MEPFLSRILIQHVQGAEIAYLYNRESFELLKIEKQEQFDNSQLIEIGQIIEYDERKFEVKSINFNMERKLFKMNSTGFNLYAPTEPSDYNCQIGILVDDAE